MNPMNNALAISRFIAKMTTYKWSRSRGRGGSMFEHFEGEMGEIKVKVGVRGRYKKGIRGVFKSGWIMIKYKI